MAIKKTLLLGLTTGAIALSATPTFSQSSPNDQPTFACQSIGGVLTSVVSGGKIPKLLPLIYWKQQYFTSENIDANCQKAARVFQNYYKNNKGHRLFISSQPKKDQKDQIVICLINIPAEKCKPESELFSISPQNNSDSDKTLSEVIDPDNLGTIKTSDIRGRDARTYSKLKFWERFWRG